jgi:hypothetical protein
VETADFHSNIKSKPSVKGCKTVRMTPPEKWPGPGGPETLGSEATGDESNTKAIFLACPWPGGTEMKHSSSRKSRACCTRRCVGQDPSAGEPRSTRREMWLKPRQEDT